MKDLVIHDELKGLEESKAAQIKAVFDPMIKTLEGFESVYADVMAEEQTEEKSKKAKRLRLDISKIRIEADKVRKSQKEEYLRAGNAIQGVYNILKFAVCDKEEKLKEVETYYERIEAEKIQKKHEERLEELSNYNCDGSTMNLGNMPDEIYVNFLSGAKQNYENALAAERKAENDRRELERKENLFNERFKSLLIYGEHFDRSRLTRDSSQEDFENVLSGTKALKSEYDKKKEEIRIENERLRKESEEAEKKAAVERKANEEALRKEREARELVERKERERIAEEIRKREEAEKIESKRIAKEKEEKKKAEMAPDKEKLFMYASNLLSEKEFVKSTEAKQAISRAVEILTSTANSI